MPSCFEVQRVMGFAARIERRSAPRACCPALQILTDRQFRVAGPAQNRLLIEVRALPHTCPVIRFGLMAIDAGIICSAAFELDRDDIKRAPIVSASRS